MNLERERQVMMLVDTALERPVQERSAFLEEACAGDLALQREVKEILRSEEDDFLQESAFTLREDPNLGRHIGAYQTVRLLGAGGMAQVYLAQRTDDFRQKVALKLIKRGMDTEEIVRRFRQERQILADLADLHHPSIARLLDGGTTPDGLPYFAMEYIDGEPLLRHCDTRRLSVGARLALFLEICSALQVAHQHLVIHRDLKPSNILVTADGVPKLLDFGIAKLLRPATPFQTLTTVPDRHLMTPLYASPEQVRGERVTTASDIYALGVVLYQLLAGHLPYRLATPAEVVRVVCEEEPKKPSTAVRQQEEIRRSDGTEELLTPESVSRARGSDPRKLRRSLCGDLDSIVLKAMDKDPRRRYGSVVELAEDIRRHLAGQPVHAHAGSFSYRAGKLVRRNRLALAVALLILGASVTTTVLWRQAVAAKEKAVAAEEEAVRQRDRAASALALLKSSFKASGPDEAKGRIPTALDILENGTRKVDELEDPALKAEVLDTLGGVYRDLGRYQEARELSERSLEMLRSIHTEDHPSLAKAINNLAGQLVRLGEYGKAKVLYFEALAMRRRLGDEGGLAKAMCNVATTLMSRGAFAEAEELYLACLEIREATYGPKDPDVATGLRSLGALYYSWGKLDEAEPYLRRAHDIRLEILEPGHTDLALTASSLGRLLLAQGKYQEAEERLREALDIRLQRLGESHPYVALTRTDLAELHLARREGERAENLLAQALASLRASRPEESWEIAHAESLSGACLAVRGRFQEAEPLLVRGYRILEKTRGPQAIYTQKALARVIDLYTAWGKAEEAAEYRALAEQRLK